MKHPPQGYDPQDYSEAILLGTAARSAHVHEADRYHAYLATRPHCIPAMIGNSYVDGATYEIMVPVSAWRQALRFRILASGRGTVTLTSADDSWNCVVTIKHGTGTSHTIDDASWITSGPPTTVSADGDNRGLDVTDQSSPHDVRVTFTLADDSGTDTLKVYTIQPFFEWHDTASALPA